MLKGKTIVLGVTGGIAAYKAVDIGSRLKKKNAQVIFVLTENAQRFVGPVTFQAISNEPVVTDMFVSPQTWDTEHISLAKRADVFLIAPATANIIGKLYNGIADDMLSTTAMATKAPLIIAPAMNTNMYLHPATQSNLKGLKNRGVIEIPPASGRLACNDVGVGKLADPQIIVKWVEHFALFSNTLLDKKIVITAGPTVELLDPVRYFTNQSSGKMGFALARQAARRGAKVVLIAGPTSLETPYGVERIDVSSAQEMDQAVRANGDFDVFVSAAAVADYRPEAVSKTKVKKKEGDWTLRMVRNPDILLGCAQRKKSNQILVGFAAETGDPLPSAREKQKKKKLDIIVANDITLEGAGFQSDTNQVQILDKFGQVRTLDIMSKDEVAQKILDMVVEQLA